MIFDSTPDGGGRHGSPVRGDVWILAVAQPKGKGGIGLSDVRDEFSADPPQKSKEEEREELVDQQQGNDRSNELAIMC